MKQKLVESIPIPKVKTKWEWWTVGFYTDPLVRRVNDHVADLRDFMVSIQTRS